MDPNLDSSEEAIGSAGSRAEFEARLQSILEDLRSHLDTSRTTLRVDIPKWGVDVDQPVAEALEPGIASIRGASIDQRSLATVKHLDQVRHILIHDDCASAEPAPPQALLDVYGVKAQMLAPLVREGKLAGWISAHYTRSTRHWKQRDVAFLKEAVSKVQRVLTGIDALVGNPEARKESN